MNNNDKSKKVNSNSNSSNQSSEQQTQDQNLNLTGQSEINATLQMVINKLENLGTNPPTQGDKSPDNETNNGDSGGDNNNGNNGGNDENSTRRPFRLPPRAELETFFTCVDLLIFELDDDVIEKLILCALFSMSLDRFIVDFREIFFPISIGSNIVRNSLKQKIESKAAKVYNSFLVELMNDFQSAENKKDYLQELIQSNKLCCCNTNSMNFYDILGGNLQTILDQNSEKNINSQFIADQLDEVIRAAVLTFFFNNFTIKFLEFQRSAGFKVFCIKRDLLFLSGEIQRLTNIEAGVFILAQALETVTSSRFAEDDEFDEVFDSVEEVADAIEQLAEIYQDRLKVLRALLPFARCEELLNIPLTGDVDFDGISDLIIGDTLLNNNEDLL